VRRLIVNADDFGLTGGVNRAVAELHQAGALTSATLMARAGATDEAIRYAAKTPSLGVGCHVVLVDGSPVLPLSEIPTLVDSRTGRFFGTLSGFLSRALTGRIKETEIEAEAAAQIALLQESGLRLTHVDTHKHTHMFPGVLRPVLRAARGAGIRAIRNPFEPLWSRRLARNAAFVRRMEVSLLSRLKSSFRHMVAEEGLMTTDGAIGVLSTGTLNAEEIRTLLECMPGGTWELVTHPGYNDAELARAGTRLLGSREIERQALAMIAAPARMELIDFAAIAASETGR
jgi:hopanoid biosynthesis associated protein HpnK